MRGTATIAAIARSRQVAIHGVATNRRNRHPLLEEGGSGDGWRFGREFLTTPSDINNRPERGRVGQQRGDANGFRF